MNVVHQIWLRFQIIIIFFVVYIKNIHGLCLGQGTVGYQKIRKVLDNPILR